MPEPLGLLEEVVVAEEVVVVALPLRLLRLRLHHDHRLVRLRHLARRHGYRRRRDQRREVGV